MPCPEVKELCVKEYLSYVRSLSTRIINLQEQIERKRALLEPSGIQYKESVSSSITDNELAEAIDNLKDLIKEFATELSEYIEQHRQAHITFSKLSRPEYARAMTSYYLHGKSWEEVCVDMRYSWDGMMKLRKKASLELYERMPIQWQKDSIPNAMS